MSHSLGQLALRRLGYVLRRSLYLPKWFSILILSTLPFGIQADEHILAAGHPILRILTLNIYQPDHSVLARWAAYFRGERSVFQRTNELLTWLARQDADIIALQEVTPSFVRALNAQSWRSAYNRVDTLTDTQLSESYYIQEPAGVLILSKFPLVRTASVPLASSRLARRMLLATVQVGNLALRLANIHLDSFPQDGAVRARQLRQAFKALVPDEHALLIGDFNFANDAQPETGALRSEYVDPWLLLHRNDPGHTYSVTENTLARANAFADEPSRRLDRILIRSSSWAPVTIRKLRVQTSAKGDIAAELSDHDAVLLELIRK